MKLHFHRCFKWLFVAATTIVAPGVAISQCSPVRFYQSVIPRQPLTCDLSTVLHSVQTDTWGGYALARLDLQVENNSGDGAIWGATTRVLVGSPSGQYSNTQGFDICDGQRVRRANLGYNFLAPNGRIDVRGWRARSDCAQRDANQVMVQGTLTIWIEDPTPACQKQDIRFVSLLNDYFRRGRSHRFVWPATWTDAEVIALDFETQSTSNVAIVAAAIEGTVTQNPYLTCSATNGHLLAGIYVNGTPNRFFFESFPGSQGAGHLSVSNGLWNTLSGLPVGRNIVSLRGVRNFFAADGGYVSTPPGDAVLGIVRAQR